MPSWSPFSGPQVGIRGAILFCVWHVIMFLWAPVSYDKHNSFSHLFISALWKKTAWNKPKRLFIPSSQHLAGLNESISLQSLVACHFSWFQVKPDAHYQLAFGWNKRLGKSCLQAWVSAPKILLLNLSCEVKQSPARGRFVLASGLKQRSPVVMTTATMDAVFVVSHLLYYMSRKGPQSLRVQRSFSAIMAHFSAEIACNSVSEKWVALPFISARCLWCLGYIRAPADLTPGLTEGRAYIFNK